jgi:hypothetical protein
MGNFMFEFRFFVFCFLFFFSHTQANDHLDRQSSRNDTQQKLQAALILKKEQNLQRIAPNSEDENKLSLKNQIDSNDKKNKFFHSTIPLEQNSKKQSAGIANYYEEQKNRYKYAYSYAISVDNLDGHSCWDNVATIDIADPIESPIEDVIKIEVEDEIIIDTSWDDYYKEQAAEAEAKAIQDEEDLKNYGNDNNNDELAALILLKEEEEEKERILAIAIALEKDFQDALANARTSNETAANKSNGSIKNML